MAERNFEPSPAEQFDGEGLSNMHDDKGDDRISKGPHDERVQKGIIAGQRDIRGKLRKGVDYGEKDKIDWESIPNLDNSHFGEEINEEDRMINRIAVRQEAQKAGEKRKILDAGKAVVIKKPDEVDEVAGMDIPQDKGTRQFQNVADLLKFKENRERAREKARQRYEQEQLKAAEAKKAPVKKKAK